MVELQLEDLDSAENAFRKVITRYRESPLVPDSYFRLADVDRNRSDFIGAVRNLKDGLRIQQSRIGEVSSEWEDEETGQALGWIRSLGRSLRGKRRLGLRYRMERAASA